MKYKVDNQQFDNFEDAINKAKDLKRSVPDDYLITIYEWDDDGKFWEAVEVL